MKSHRNAILLLVILTAPVQAQEVSRPQPRPASVDRQSPGTVQNGRDVGEGEVIRVTASLVSVPVSVMDRQGKYVVDLQQKDFRIYEDGVEQSITHFSNVDQPFSVVLLLDTSGSTTAFLTQMKEAAKSFVEQLRPVDAVQPVYFHGEIKPLTTKSISNPDLLKVAIDQISPGPLDMGTRLYDAVDFALSAQQAASGRKAVILFTDGENTWGKASMKSTLHQAEESDVIIYALQYGNPPAQKYLQQLAEKTGGRYLMAADANAIATSFGEIAAELRRQYVLGYQPTELAQQGLERKIRVKVRRPRVAVRARRSYTMNRHRESAN
ncbi:MAG: VWA domain-containing protein [Pyrinomonadaceae bacterium]|nr:VWA domain-containing protein [Pyrinomonadaceae bacterium]